MSGKKWTFKDNRLQIITGVVITIIASVGGGIWKYAQAVPETLVAKKEIRSTLEKYADGINNNTFDANYYFASEVTSFFEAPQINSPRLINNYWNTQFAKLFSHMQVRMMFDSMKVQDKVDHYRVCIPMHSDYYQTDIKQQVTNERSDNYFEFDRDFMITSVTQKVWKSKQE